MKKLLSFCIIPLLLLGCNSLIDQRINQQGLGSDLPSLQNLEEYNIEAQNQSIEEYRKGYITLQLTDAFGNPLPEGTLVEVKMIRHEFLFGCNIYHWGGFDGNREMQDLYREQFAELFNYATIPFYWDWYEGEPGKYDNNTHSMDTALWCREQGIETKGHPLIWHEIYPSWAMRYSSEELELQLQQRMEQIITDFDGLVDRWDLINESQISHRFQNPIGRWVEELGPVESVSRAYQWAMEIDDQDQYLINDYDVKDWSYFNQIQALQQRDCPISAIGVQSHMHHGYNRPYGIWSDSDIINVCDRLAATGLPIHFTELTVISGNFMWGYDYHTNREYWPSTERGEQRQAQELERIYRLLFSLPQVEAITYWDFSDHGAWLNAPAGLLRKDLSPKPAYDVLMDLVQNQWRTELELPLGEGGRLEFRGFYGDYICLIEGVAQGFTLASDGASELELVFPEP